MEVETCERIVNNINNIINEDHELDEFGTVFSNGETNQTPVIHVNHKLAIGSWCIKYIHQYLHSKIQQYRSSPHSLDGEEVLKFTKVYLLLMPEVISIWNVRRTLFKKSRDFCGEYSLTHLILTYKPKCLEAFNYRKWLLKQSLVLASVAEGDLFRSIRRELELSLLTANLRENNYHSWNHRSWCLSLVQCQADKVKLVELYMQEYELISHWVSTNISQHSAMHYLLNVLDRIADSQKHFKDDCSSKQLILKLLIANRHLIEHYPGHESLLYQRKGILQRLFLLKTSPTLYRLNEMEKMKLIAEEKSFINQVQKMCRGYVGQNYAKWFEGLFMITVQ